MSMKISLCFCPGVEEYKELQRLWIARPYILLNDEFEVIK